MIRISFEAPTSHGLFIEIKNYCESFANITAQGEQPGASKKLDGAGGFEPVVPAGGLKPSAVPIKTETNGKKSPGRPKKSREEHLTPVVQTSPEVFSEEDESDVETPPVDVETISAEQTAPPKITKETCVEVLKKVSSLPDGISKVREIFKKFGAERLSGIDEKRYHELIKVAEQTTLEA